MSDGFVEPEIRVDDISHGRGVVSRLAVVVSAAVLIGMMAKRVDDRYVTECGEPEVQVSSISGTLGYYGRVLRHMWYRKCP
tara:strand:+ start:184 stop:426 length:243 start_codon:yes stop_codon:yes gene_type:complete